MKIYIGGLSPQDSTKSVSKLVKDLTKGPWYKFNSSPVQIVDCRFKQMSNTVNGRVTYSAVIEISHNRLAWNLINKLNGMVHNGQTLKAHKWFPRRNLPDRRVNYMHRQEKEDIIKRCRRSGRDRRQNLKIDSLQDIRIAPVAGFQRVYGK